MKRLSLCMLGALLALLSAEALARYFWPRYALKAVGSNDAQWCPPYRLFRPSGLLGWERNPDSDDRIKADGFRSAHIRLSDRPGRVLFIGDSLTDALTGSYFGADAERALTEMEGRPTEIWDFSGAGYDMEHYRRILETKCRDFSPDALVTVFCLNDALSRHIPVVFPIGEKLYMVQGISVTGASEVNAFLFKWSHLYRVYFLSRDWQRVDDLSDVTRFYQTVRYIRAWCLERDVKPFFVVFPLFKSWKDYTSEEERALKTTVESLRQSNVPSLLLWDVFPADYATRFRNIVDPNDYIHPNPEGYKAAARLILGFLRDNWRHPVQREISEKVSTPSQKL